MKKINGLIFIVISVFLALMFLINFFVSQSGIWDGGREYRISINRIRQAVVDYEKENGNYPKNIDVLKEFSKTDFPLITEIFAINSSDTESLTYFLDNGDSDYVVITTDNYL